MTTLFISCDWGTSSFRLRLIKTTPPPTSIASYADSSPQASPASHADSSPLVTHPDSSPPASHADSPLPAPAVLHPDNPLPAPVSPQPENTVLASISNPSGIATTFEAWRHSGLPEDRRLQFYQTFLHEQIQLLQNKTRIILKDLPLNISGMASSTLGMIELPYRQLPAYASDLNTKTLPATKEFPHPTTIISGLRTENDVLRGEETLLLGALPETPETRALYILPGTHSKHIYLEGNKIINFQTFMTGEFFALLTKHSVLAASIAIPANAAPEAFAKGIQTSLGSPLLHTAFLTRTNDLFNVFSKEENHHFLSGLLIGAELQSLPKDTPLTLVSDGALLENYRQALMLLGHHEIRIVDASKALIKAHQIIMP